MACQLIAVGTERCLLQDVVLDPWTLAWALHYGGVEKPALPHSKTDGWLLALRFWSIANVHFVYVGSGLAPPGSSHFSYDWRGLRARRGGRGATGGNSSFDPFVFLSFLSPDAWKYHIANCSLRPLQSAGKSGERADGFPEEFNSARNLLKDADSK